MSFIYYEGLKWHLLRCSSDALHAPQLFLYTVILIHALKLDGAKFASAWKWSYPEINTELSVLVSSSEQSMRSRDDCAKPGNIGNRQSSSSRVIRSGISIFA